MLFGTWNSAYRLHANGCLDFDAFTVTHEVTQDAFPELPQSLQMEISFKDAALRRYAEDTKLAQRKLGAEMAKKYQLRLVALIAARNLAVFLPPFRGPERCHELVGNLSGIFSMDLKHPYRLLFESTAPFESGSTVTVKQKWESINSVTLIAIKDTHE